MGICKEVKSIRFGADDLRRVSELMDAFAPMWEDFSEAVLGSLKILHSQVVTPEIMDALGDTLQKLRSHTSSYASFADSEQRKPGPCRLDSKGGRSAGLGNSSQFTASKRANAGSDFLLVRRSSESHPFLGAVRLMRRVA